MHHNLNYRPHIDGLRAIAVAGVVLFHFGATALPGGFIGVDVFFVISGFLISKSLYREIATGEFSIVDFYERRARRILPAFTAVSLVTAIAAFFILLPQALISFAKTLLAASLFAGNIYFYGTSGYFSPEASQIPLLHYWSLGVEEQFYIIFPVLVSLVYRFLPRALPATITALILASLVAAEAMLKVDPSAVFYLLPFRAFELLLGSLVALPGFRFSSDRLVSGLSVLLGLALITGGMALIDEAVAFPGVTALVPCLGAALVIWGGEKASTIPSQIISSQPFLFIGKISYSLYLVHWPLVVFGLRLFPHADRLIFLVAGCGASLFLAWVSYRYVEQPVRQYRSFWTKRTLFAASGAMLFVIILSSAVVVQLQGFPGRIAGKVNEVLSYNNYDYIPMFREGVCFLRPEQKANELNLEACIPSDRPMVMLWGDSAIAHYYWGLRELLSERGFQLGQLTASACPPIIGIDIPPRPNCAGFNDFAIAEIVKARPDLVVLGALWWQLNEEQLSALDLTIKRLRDQNINVVMLGPTPRFKDRVPNILANRLAKGDNKTIPENDFMDEVYSTDMALKKHMSNRNDVRYISVLDAVCVKRQCSMSENGIPLYWDVIHVTREGSYYYSERLIDKLLNSSKEH